jgi:pilus assembly protein CpaC
MAYRPENLTHVRRPAGISARLSLLAFAFCIAALGDAGPLFANGDAPPPGTVVMSNPQTDVRSVKLGLNKSLVVDLPRDASDVLVSNPAVADAVIRTSRRIYLTGVAIGQTNIIVFDRAGQQIVSLELEVERDSRTLAAMLQRLIPGSAIDVELVSDNIVLSGTVRNAADARRAQDIANIFANGGAKAQGGGGGGSASTGSGGGTSISISAVAQEVPQSNIVNLLQIEGEDQVHLKVTVAEVNRNAIKQLGVDWDLENVQLGEMVFSVATNSLFPINTSPPGSSATGAIIDYFSTPVVGGEAGATTTARESIGATVSALEQSGVLRTLAEPTLTAISGEQASFLAGGEFPVPVGASDGALTIEFKPFGVALAFTPVVLSEGRISLRVKTEVSELSQEGAIELLGASIPSLQVRRAETTLELPSGGSMVMGGLLQDDVRQAITGIPGLKKLPVLGSLFRSRDYIRNETELVIIVTPYLVKPVARPMLARPDDGFSTPNDFEATFLGRLNNVYGGPGQAPTGSYQGRYGYIYE